MHVIVVLLFGGIRGEVRRLGMAIAGVDSGECGAGDEELRWC